MAGAFRIKRPPSISILQALKMLQSFIIALREGVEAALVIGIAVAYLNKSGRANQVRTVYWALAAAVVSSLAVGWYLSRIQINQEAFEGWLLLLAAFFVGTMVIWMHRTARGLRREIEQRLESIHSVNAAPALGIFLFVFLMVFREGVETVLMLGSLSLNTSDLLNSFAVLAGLGSAIVFGVLFVRGSVRLDLRKFFQITTVILLFVVLQLTIGGLHELSEAQVLPSSPWEMAVIGPIVSNDVFFFITILALAALMILFDWRSRQSIPLPADSLSSAEHRKLLWQAKRDKMWTGAVCASSFLFVLMVTAQFLYAKNQTELSPSTVISEQSGVVRIPVASVSDGNLHRFTYSAGDTHARFIVIKTGDRIATALDACVICGSQGYYQNGPNVFCKNCSAAIYPPTIGIAGGCNPVPLSSTVEGSDIVIPVSELTRAAGLFLTSE